MKSNSEKLWFGYDVVSEVGRFPRPQRIEFWKNKDFESLSPENPFHYKSDALLGLSLYLLHPNWKTNHLPAQKTNLSNDLWKALEPHHELYLRAQPRVQALRGLMKHNHKEACEQFSRSLSEVLMTAQTPTGLDLEALHPITELADTLEAKTGRPLLYDFSLQFTPEVRQQMHWLHSMAFHLRTMIAMDHNAYIQDATHEALRVDSITDYIARGEYVSNDALLYWNFKKLKSELPPEAAAKLEDAFLTYSHNGAYLIESLPKSFLSGLRTEELEGSLYLVQMDWLLGTDAGLLFRLREEIYGLIEGYDKIFWTDELNLSPRHAERLSVQCQITEATLTRAA